MTELKNLPILYSFRRCPYAIRARFALKLASIKICLREVHLKNKPPNLLEASAKGTVPVLVLPDGKIIDESLDIIQWALKNTALKMSTKDSTLIKENDRVFAGILNAHKYPHKFPHIDQEQNQAALSNSLSFLEKKLCQHKFLLGEHFGIADIAIFPFIRQLARINEEIFKSYPFPKLQAWLAYFLTHHCFVQAMQKFPVWHEAEGEGEFF